MSTSGTQAHHDPGPLVIVFGARGRLGARLLPLLTTMQVSVLGIARHDKPVSCPQGIQWMQFDVTNPGDWPRSLGALVDVAGVHHRVVLADLLLDRATVTAMRRSIAAVTAYILRLRDRLAADRRCSLIAASTTATLAPWPYQTPYGLAKRRQLKRYASSGMPGVAFLLPSLVEASPNDSMRPWPVWTYHEAAETLASTIAPRPTTIDDPPFRLIVPGSSTNVRKSDKHSSGTILRALVRSFPSHVALLLHQRDSPRAHRAASHDRLLLTPTRLRRHIDHHHIPPGLVRRLGEWLDRHPH